MGVFCLIKIVYWYLKTFCIMEFQRVLVTPEIAKSYLTKNKNNRPVKNKAVLKYSKEMQSGRWKQNTAELIKISVNGNVLDGQHRLMAVIHSGVSVYFHFAFDVEENVFDVLDSGCLRNTSDSFFINKIKNSNVLPSMISLHYVLTDKTRDDRFQKNTKLSTTEILEKYSERSEFWDSVAHKSVNWYGAFAKILAPSTIGAIYSLSFNVNEEKANKFMTEVCTGYDISNPIVNILRNTLMKDKISLRKMPMDLKLALIIKSWNFYKTNTTAKILKWDGTNEKFPTI